MALLGIAWSKTVSDCTLASLFGDLELPQSSPPAAPIAAPALIATPPVLLLPSAGPFAETAFLRQQLDATSKGFVASLVRSNLLDLYQDPSSLKNGAIPAPPSSETQNKKKRTKAKASTKRSRPKSPSPPPPPVPTLSLEMLPALLRAFDATAADAYGKGASSGANNNVTSNDQYNIDSDVATWCKVLREAPRAMTVPVRKWHEKVRGPHNQQQQQQQR